MGEYNLFKLGDLFKFEAIKQAKSQKNIPTDNNKATSVPYIVQSMFHNMFSRRVNRQWLVENNEPPVSGNRIVLGVTLPAVSYQPVEFGASQVITARADWLNRRTGNYIVTVISKLMFQFSYSKKPGLQVYKDMEIALPVTASGEIDFLFMENHVRELELARIRELVAYLQVTGLTDYQLSTDEEKFIEHYNNFTKQIGTEKQHKPFRLGELFEHIVQGRRLKKEDHISGDFPFVMSGVTNTGLVAKIANPINRFPANSITVDIFGNTFYRSYAYSASDDVGVYWSDNPLSRESMLYMTAAISKHLEGKYSYGDKLRASQSVDFQILLPADDSGMPDYDYMTTFIRIQQKLAIKNVVEWKDRELDAYQGIVAS